MTDYVYFIANKRCCGYRMYTSVLLLHGQSGSSFLGIHHHVPRRSDKYFHPFCKWGSWGKCNAGSYVSYEGRAWKLTDEASYSSYYSFWFAPTCPSRGGKRSGYYANSVVNGPVFDGIADSFFNAEGQNNVYGTARRGVMGHSMGGYGALKFSLFFSIYNLSYVACANGATVPDSQSFYASDYGAKCGRKCMCPEGFSHSGARCYSIGRARGTSTELLTDEMTTSTLSFFLGGIRCVKRSAGFRTELCNFYADRKWTTFGSQYYAAADLQYGSGNNVHYNRSPLGWSYNDGTGMKNIWATYSNNNSGGDFWYNWIMDMGYKKNGDLPIRTNADLKCSKDAWDGCGAGASKSSKIMDSIDSGHWLKAFIAGTGCSSLSYFYIEGDRYDGIYGTNKRMHDAAKSLLRANGCYRVYRYSGSSGGHWLGLFRKFAALSRFAAGKRCNAYCSTTYCRCSYRGYMGASTYWWHNCRFFHGNAPPAVRLMLNDCDANVGKEKSSYVSGCYHNMCPISHEKQNAFIDEITKQAKGKLRDFQTKNWSKSWYRKANNAFWDAWNNSIKAANKVTTKTDMSGSGSTYTGKRLGRKLQSSRHILASLNAGSMGVFGVSDEFALGRDFGSASATSFTFTGFGARTGISTTPGGNVGSNMCASAFKACAIFSWGPIPRVCRPHDYCYNKYSCDSYGSWCAQWGPNNCKKFNKYCRLTPQ